MAGPKTNIRKIGDWDKARRALPRLAHEYKKAENMAVHQEALLYQRKVSKAFKTSGQSNGKKWKPNSSSTRQRKGSAKPLIDTGDLMGSIHIQKVGASKFFVGVPSNARSKDGKSLVSIGSVHENGKVIVIKVTKKMHAFVMAELAKFGAGGGGGSNSGGSFRPGSILTIRIPQRSFLQATMDAHFSEAQMKRRIKGRIAAHMAAKFGNVVKLK